MIRSGKRSVGWLVLCSFMVFLTVSALPLRGEEATRSGSGGAAVAPAGGDDAMPGAVEKETPEGKKFEKKKFPWLLVAAGAVVIGVAVYFLLIKKPKYALTVTVASGASGTPAAGTYEYKKGTAVNYNYSLQANFTDLVVKLDGTVVPASGTIIMDGDHALTVASAEGLQENFSSGPPSNWVWFASANWSVTAGVFRCLVAGAVDWQYALYNHAWSSANYTVTVRLNRVANTSTFGIALLNSTNMAAAYGFNFVLDTGGNYGIFRMGGYGFVPYLLGPLAALKNWTSSSAINEGVNKWNVFKIVKAGANYTFYANNVSLFTFNDTTYDPRYVAIVLYTSSGSNQLDIDYVNVELGSGSTVVPWAPAAQPTPAPPAVDLLVNPGAR